MRLKTPRLATLTIAAALTGLLFFGSAAFAHSGGTNKYGCHNDNKQGGYHCHRSGC
jgi:hypothetical protein